MPPDPPTDAPQTANLRQDLEFIIALARSAGELVRSKYGHVERLTKTHATTTEEPVTEADRAAQRHIVAALTERFPDDGLVGEESDTGESITFQVKNPNGRNWVIDPVDGTNNFIAGFGAFAVCIGLLDAGMPVLGVVYDVTRDVCYAGAAGLGVTVNGKPAAAVGTPLNSSSVLMITSNLTDARGHVPRWPCDLLRQTTWKVRILGSAALEGVAVAAGVAHAAVTVNGKLWDAAAPAALVLASGGTFTAPDGAAIFPFDLRGYDGGKVPFLAAGPAAHDQMLALIRDGR